MAFDVHKAAREIKKRAAEEKEFLEKRKKEARLEAARIASALKDKDPQIRHIYGFGSVFSDSGKYSRYSDIDLAIEGGNIFSLISTAEKSSFRVDLIEITGKNDYFEKKILETGTRLI